MVTKCKATVATRTNTIDNSNLFFEHRQKYHRGHTRVRTCSLSNSSTNIDGHPHFANGGGCMTIVGSATSIHHTSTCMCSTPQRVLCVRLGSVQRYLNPISNAVKNIYFPMTQVTFVEFPH